MTFAMLFPGQGSQSVGMLKAWAERSDAVRDTLAEADAVLGRPLSTLLAEGPSCQLDRTENTQPAMLVADVALWRAWLEVGGPRPAAVAGHSLGEYAALVAAGGLEFAAALEVVQARAEAMRDAVADGARLAREAAALDRRLDVEVARGPSHSERLDDLVHQRLAHFLPPLVAKAR